MSTLSQVSTIGSLILILVGIGTIIYRIGKSDQNVASKLGRVDEVLTEFSKHVKDESIHVNARLQEHLQLEQRDWRRNIDDKLNLLLTGRKEPPSNT